MINIKNFIENLLYILVIAGLLILNTYFVLSRVDNIINNAVNQAVNRATVEYRTEIKNKKGEIKMNSDTTTTVKKKHWWLFR